MPPSEFHREFVVRGRPAIITDATDGWPARTSLSRKRFIARYGGATWQPQYLLRGNATALGAYLRRAAAGTEPRPIAFNRPIDARLLSELGEYVPNWPSALARAAANGSRAGLDWFVGPKHAGLPAHWHGGVWNALLWGSKLWALAPPAAARFDAPQQHPIDAEWWRAWRARGAAGGAHGGTDDGATESSGGGSSAWRHCVQRAGDAIYVPSGWAHGTVNLRESLGVGGFLHDEASLGLHMQLVHAPRGIGSLMNAATIHAGWRRAVSRAFPPAG